MKTIEQVLTENAERWTLEDWQYEVANGDTVLGFHEWRQHNAEAELVQ